jgi:hypothetical protein
LILSHVLGLKLDPVHSKLSATTAVARLKFAELQQPNATTVTSWKNSLVAVKKKRQKKKL